MRYARQAALASDVDAMCGGTTGNILNAIDIDEDGKSAPNIVIVAGQNELTANITPEEFLCILKKKHARLVQLAASRRVGLLTPPPQKQSTPIEKVKEQVFREEIDSLRTIDNNSITTVSGTT